MKAKESATSVTVCNGCCCGRTEKGHSEIPLDNLKDSWRKFNLEDKIKLTISDCLGPCSMHNVTLLKTSKGQTWLGKLNQEEHYSALVKWACNIKEQKKEIALPKILLQNKFNRNEIQ